MNGQLLENLRLKKEVFLCARNPVYFMERYVNCAHSTHGTIPFAPHPFQEEYMEAISKGNTIVSAARQAGSSITTSLYLFWEGFFQKKTQWFVANKIDLAADNMQHIRHAYMTMPAWMRDSNPLVVNNKNHLEFANGSRFCAATASEHAFRGTTIDSLFMDNFSSIRTADDVLSSAIPALMRNKDGKIIIVSSGDGSELFNDMFSDATQGLSSFTAVRIVPDDY